MHDPCYKFREKDSGGRGECCCNCNYSRPINAHPWNKNYFAKGKVSEIIGYGCTHPEFWPYITFFESMHGMCEVWEERQWPDPTKEEVWKVLTG